MPAVAVEDREGRHLSGCSLERAHALVQDGAAEWVSTDPPRIRLHRSVAMPAPAAPTPHPLAGKRVLLHICCGPCATFTVQALREVGAEVTGYWYNPNIHPYSEHERRREAVAQFAAQVDLPMMWSLGYDITRYMRAICGHERIGERCSLCYRLRLESTALAARDGFDAFTTTLLISPYQQIEEIHRIGDELAAEHGVPFYWENLRRGFAEHHRLSEEHGLYRQRYCGCLYSEWEALDPEASTRRRAAEPYQDGAC